MLLFLGKAVMSLAAISSIDVYLMYPLGKWERKAKLNS